MSSLEERLWSKISPEPNTGCWLWTGAGDAGGYGKMGIDRKTTGAHRVSYEVYIGPIPDGLEINHLCRVRCCVNPDHLEAVTRSENAKYGDTGKHLADMERVKTHCPVGHEYSPENTLIYSGSRACRACRKQRNDKFNAIAKARRAAARRAL